ncbi:virulence factor TspB C-terminal domain-related protein [Cupriavidus taiwanensis]|uniref:virulence factor TspB C-terminal domain-related protein n=1 Tax=Cupriavidus taiwanensis TaxID=164546 RepID=UPI0039C2EF8D
MAAAIPLTLPANVAASGSNYITSASASFSGAAFNSALTTQVAGKAVTVPATWRLASNAGQFAISAVRLSPATLVGSAVASWLLPYGIEWLNNQFQTTTPGQPASQWGGGYNYQCTGAPAGPITIQAAIQCGTYAGWTNITNVQISVLSGKDYKATASTSGNPNATIAVFSYIGTCPAGTTNTGTSCVTAQTVGPTTESDWSRVQADPVPDAVHSWLANKGLGVPIVPQVNPATQVVPLSDPYVDPVTGKRYKDVAYVTPSPSSPTKTADLQVAKQEVDAEGNPIVDPTTGGVKAPEETDDPCLAHPDRIGCMEKGEIPAEPEIKGADKTITITPDGGWGAETASCPADLTATTRTGGTLVTFSFKPACDAADTFRPLVIGLAWLAAVLIALGVGRKGD